VGVGVDNRAGARLVTEHLLELGHRRIAFVAGPSTSSEAPARWRSWRDVMAAAGLDTDLCYFGDWGSESGYDAGRRMLRAAVQPTAVFAANDQMALGVIAAFTEAGRRVPDDVSVAGFDDVPDAAYFTPALTTVHQDFEALASRCVTLLERILRGEPARSARVRPQLVVRASTAAPARSELR
jgi:DNA-binding LacI/PurR family transcriptional regulator